MNTIIDSLDDASFLKPSAKMHKQINKITISDVTAQTDQESFTNLKDVVYSKVFN